MDPLLLKYYERELQYIREMGAEYAAEFPKIASRLGIDGVDTTDPYVERLYEGFAFLAARVHLRIDAEYPRFTQNLLNIVYPQYLTPTPSMTVVQLNTSPNASLDAGVAIPRGTALKSKFKDSGQIACKFRTAHDLTLWPIKISEAEYFSNIGGILDNKMRGNLKPKAGLRLRLESTGEQPLNEILLDNLVVHLSGQGAQSMRLYELIMGNCCAVQVRSAESGAPWNQMLPSNAIKQVGFADNQSLFPEDQQTFSGYRLLREYFAFPDRFMFVDFTGLGSAMERTTSTAIELIVLFEKHDQELENRVTTDDFALNCTPAINLFPKRADRIHVSEKDTEYHVIPDRTRALDFEVFQVTGVSGHGANKEEKRSFLPFYACNDLTDYPDQLAFYNLRRERRVLSTKQRRRGPRSSYVGSETFLSLVDLKEAPFSSDLKQLEIHTLCTNRDLPLQMPVGKGDADFYLDVSAPVDTIRCIKGPTRPKPSLSSNNGEVAWRLINQLSLNYLSLVDGADGRGASALRELLNLYGDINDASTKKQIEGIRSVRSEQVTRRVPASGPIAFGRGLRITLTFDESAFVGSGVFLLGSVLEHFFARYVSINSFTETVIESVDRGEIMKWPVRIGQKQIV